MHHTTTTGETHLAAPARIQVARRIGVRTFYTLLVLQLLIIAGAGLWLLANHRSSVTAFTATGDLAIVRESIWARLQGFADDPLIAGSSGSAVRESNLRGFRLNGTIYYYYVEGGVNRDPLSRGSVTPDQVEILLRDADGPYPIVIYTLR